MSAANCGWCRVGLHGHGDNGCQDCADCLATRAHDFAANDELDAAINTVAMRVIANLAERVDEEWENYPEIGERDWRAVQDRVAFIAGELNPDGYFAAYGLLERRANGVEA